MSTPTNPEHPEVIPAGEGPDISTMPRVDAPDMFKAFEQELEPLIEGAGKLAIVPGKDVSLVESKMARTARLALRDVRIRIEHARVELGEEALRRKKAIDAEARTYRERCEQAEQKLLEIEQYAERQEEKRIAELKEERDAALVAVGADPAHFDSGKMDPEKFEQLVSGMKLAAEAKAKKEREDEEKRIADAKAAEEERARVAAENERLRKEAEAKQAELEKERKAREAERAAAEKERLRIEAERDAERKRLEAEREKERAAERAKAAEIERKAAEQREREAKAAEAERKRVEAEREKERAAEKAKAAEIERKAAEQREREAKAAEAERRRVAEAARIELEAAQAREAAERRKREAAEAEAKRLKAEEEAKAKKLEEERLAALAAPDKDKLTHFAAQIRAIQVPKLDTTSGKKKQSLIESKVAEFATWIETQAKAI